MKLKWEIVLSIGSLVVLALLFWWGIDSRILIDQEKMRLFVQQFGNYSVIALIVLQVAQVVFPFVPGGVGMVVATLLFGIWWGFVINYISIVIGSFIAFGIGRKHGKNFIRKFFSEALFEKYEKLLEKQDKFDKIFIVSILMPIAPDDFLCYLAGASNMDVKKFALTILLAKPLTTFVYSLGLHEFWEFIKKLLRISASLFVF